MVYKEISYMLLISVIGSMVSIMVLHRAVNATSERSCWFESSPWSLLHYHALEVLSGGTDPS